MYKVGLGQDSHWFEKKKKKPLILGGVEISKTEGLKANSDGDVVLHSLCNALSSAIGGDSLGTWADRMYYQQGVTDSKKFVKKIMGEIKNRGYAVVNTAISIEAKKPRIDLKDFQGMKKKIGKLLGIKSTCVGITVTSAKGITPFGKGLAMQVFTTLLLKKRTKCK